MKTTAQKPQKKKVSYYRKPDDMTVEEWQIALRKQFAEKQNFTVKNTGDHPVFSDFRVYNPETSKEYKVAIRSYEFGDNFCSCPDFKVTELGTCKHIEYVLKQLKENPDNKKYWEKGYQRPYSSISLRYGSERKVRLRVGTTNSEKINHLAGEYFDENNFLLPDKFFDIIIFITKIRNLDPDFKMYNDALEFIIDERSKKNREEIADKIFDKGVDSKYFDNLIKTKLYPYQKEGIIKTVKAGRVIIADDMGLGKTIQAIAAAEFFARELNIESVLIICPTSLKYQWKNEIAKFTDRSARVIEGPLDKRKPQYKADEFFKIASYGVGLNDMVYLNEAGFDLIILDEAQRIKNWKTKTAKGLKQLKSQYAIVLTGTPLENKLDELHSIVEFIDPFKLGALFRFLDKHQIKEAETGKVIGYQNLNDISKVLKDILIRRTKQEILSQLPERIDKNYFVGVTDEQWDIHQDYDYIVARLVAKWRRLGFLPEKDRQRLLISLSCMRMVSDSTYILDQESRHDKKINELVTILKEIFESGNDKVVIFSQWERMTRLVGRELREMGIAYEYLHGGVPSAKRKDLIDNFSNDPEKRVFLSTDAGGVGLNLQAANVVINLDLPWNPAVLEQRIGRVHRLGQTKPVRVINLISKSTIEHRILGVIGFKKSIFEGVLDGGEDQVVMDESRFSKLMKTVEQLDEFEIAEHLAEDKKEDKEEKELTTADIPGSGNGKPKKEAADRGEKAKEPVPQKEEEKVEPPPGAPQMKPEIAELFTAGANFLNQLGNTFGKMQTGEISVNDFIEKDEKTGQTSIKIPVQSEETVVNAINTLAGLLGSFVRKK
ncbi:MAG: DEAD/DEAH box helicase [Chlorobi bacterium]|nr:DEAD/DEAH box helicase [Chlorobiota bacterium]